MRFIAKQKMFFCSKFSANVCFFVRNLKVIYAGEVLVNIGDELTPTETRDPPISIKWTAEPTSFYTLVFLGNY